MDEHLRSGTKPFRAHGFARGSCAGAAGGLSQQLADVFLIVKVGIFILPPQPIPKLKPEIKLNLIMIGMHAKVYAVNIRNILLYVV